MELLVDRLSTTPRAFRFESGPAWWEPMVRTGEIEPRLAGRAVFALETYKMGEDVYVEGTAEATFECGCGRCLARYRHRLREPFRIVLEPAAGRVPSDPEGAEALARDGVWLGDELDAGWYRGSEIDLTRTFQEVVALALPVQPRCREDCRGLCPQCGADRNVETCACVDVARSSPFAVLERLRPRQGE